MPYSWSPRLDAWKLVLRRSGLVLALKVAGALAGYAFAYLALRRLGAGGYGYFELAFTVLSIGSVASFARFPPASRKPPSTLSTKR
jgi:O-antigen/teichoic acid export membrane protein